MPARYWIPLEVEALPQQHHLHAVISSWFDRDAPTTMRVDHGALIKPYTISPPSIAGSDAGVEVTTLSEAASETLEIAIRSADTIRLGSRQVRIGIPELLDSETWAELASVSSVAPLRWRVGFLTPTVFRSGRHEHAMPTANLVLRSAQQAWNTYSELQPIILDRGLTDAVHPVDMNLRTQEIWLGKNKHRGVTGWVTYRSREAETAAVVSPLFALLDYCGIGSYRIKGMGQAESHAQDTAERTSPHPGANG